MSLIEGSGIVPDDAPAGVRREMARRYLSQFFNRRQDELSLIAMFMASSMFYDNPYHSLSYDYV